MSLVTTTPALPTSPQQSGGAEARPTRKLRICHVSMCLSTGGLERLLVEFARRTDPARFELQFVALGEIGSPAEEIRALGIPVHSLDWTGRRRRQHKLRQFRQILQAAEVDLLHTHNTYAHFYGTYAARRAGVPLIINTQHGRGCGGRWQQRVHFHLANWFTDRVFAVSADSARICRQQDRWHARKISPLWNGIDLDRFEYHGPAAGSQAISVARLSPEKNFPVLLQAVAIVVANHPEFELTIVGDGSERNRLERLTDELQIRDHVHFLGERSDVPELLRQASMFVSATSTEGISLTLLEAMAVGLPIITTRVGGNPEVVENGVTGHLVPVDDPRALANAICHHLADRDHWTAMAELSRQRVSAQFSIHRMIADYEAVYTELGQRRGLISG